MLKNIKNEIRNAYIRIRYGSNPLVLTVENKHGDVNEVIISSRSKLAKALRGYKGYATIDM